MKNEAILKIIYILPVQDTIMNNLPSHSVIFDTSQKITLMYWHLEMRDAMTLEFVHCSCHLPIRPLNYQWNQNSSNSLSDAKRVRWDWNVQNDIIFIKLRIMWSHYCILHISLLWFIHKIDRFAIISGRNQKIARKKKNIK